MPQCTRRQRSDKHRRPTMEESFRTAMMPCVLMPPGLDHSQTRELARKYVECRDKQHGMQSEHTLINHPVGVQIDCRPLSPVAN